MYFELTPNQMNDIFEKLALTIYSQQDEEDRRSNLGDSFFDSSRQSRNSLFSESSEQRTNRDSESCLNQQLRDSAVTKSKEERNTSRKVIVLNLDFSEKITFEEQSAIVSAVQRFTLNLNP